MTKTLLRLLPLLCSLAIAQGQVSLQFSTIAAALTNLSDSAGLTGMNGLTWGIIVDSEDNGFGHLNADLSEPYLLVSGAELSPGDFFFPAGTTETFPFGAEAGPGSATTTPPLDVYSIPAISNGAPFALVWFDQGISAGATLVPGSNYGIITDPTFTLPPNGSSLAPYSAIFAGPDPIRPTNLEVGIILPPFTHSFVADHFALEFEIEIATGGNVTFDLESSTSGLPNDWSPQGITPNVLSDDGTKRVLQLIHPSSTITAPNLLVRLIGAP